MEAEMIKKKSIKKRIIKLHWLMTRWVVYIWCCSASQSKWCSVMVVQAMVEIAKLITTSKNSRLYKNYIGKSK